MPLIAASTTSAQPPPANAAVDGGAAGFSRTQPPSHPSVTMNQQKSSRIESGNQSISEDMSEDDSQRLPSLGKPKNDKLRPKSGPNPLIPNEAGENMSVKSEAESVHEESSHCSDRNDVISVDSFCDEVGIVRSTRNRSTLQSKWERMFVRLLAFREKHGHCLVPNRYTPDQSLGAWVSTQRRQFKMMTSGDKEATLMNPERASRLNALGFVWSTTDPRHIPWDQRFNELVEYKNKFGDTCVPIGYKDNPQLGNWVSTQRQEMRVLKLGRNTRLDEGRIAKLKGIGFLWEAPRGGNRKRVNDGVDRPETDGKRQYRRTKGKKENHPRHEVLESSSVGFGVSPEKLLSRQLPLGADQSRTHLRGVDTSLVPASHAARALPSINSQLPGDTSEEQHNAWKELHAAFSESVKIHAAIDGDLANDLGFSPSLLLHTVGLQGQVPPWLAATTNGHTHLTRPVIDDPYFRVGRPIADLLAASAPRQPYSTNLLPFENIFSSQGTFQGRPFIPGDSQTAPSRFLLGGQQQLGNSLQQQHSALARGGFGFPGILMPGVSTLNRSHISNQVWPSDVQRYAMRMPGMGMSSLAATSGDHSSFPQMSLLEQSAMLQRIQRQRQAAQLPAGRSQRCYGDVYDDADEGGKS